MSRPRAVENKKPTKVGVCNATHAVLGCEDEGDEEGNRIGYGQTIYAHEDDDVLCQQKNMQLKRRET
uniref:Uncharacterized protein n=1 Tax=Steinernema glaseri TaxID=37863 RepID=A0A1I7YWW7_9BILA